MKSAGTMGAAVLVAVAAAGVPRQQPFQTTTRLIRLDVSVLDHARQPVRDLTRDDFRIMENGRRLTIRNFQSVSVPDAGVAQPALSAIGKPAPSLDPAVPISPSPQPADDPFGTNPGRLMVLVMDDDMTPANPRWGIQAKAIARSIVGELGPSDRMAVRFTKSGTTSLELTSDKTRLLETLERWSLGGFLALPASTDMQGTISLHDEVPRFNRTIAALSHTVESLAGLTDRQKIIVYVGTGLPVDQAAPGSLLSAYHGDLLLAMAAVFRDAARANVVVYTFDPSGVYGIEDYVYEKFYLARRVVAGPSRPTRTEAAGGARVSARAVANQTVQFSQAVAENTGGRALVRSDMFEPAVRQLFVDTSFYYLIAVEPLSPTPDGRFHQVSVNVTRSGVDVRARRGYYYEP